MKIFKILTAFLMILLLSFSIFFYFYTENLKKEPINEAKIEEILQSKIKSKETLFDKIDPALNILINKDKIINDNINMLKAKFQNNNIIISPFTYYINLYSTNKLLNHKNVNTDLSIFGETEKQITNSLTKIFEKINNSDKDNVKIYNNIFINKNKLINEKEAEALKNNFNVNIEHTSFSKQKDINSKINYYYLDRTEDLLKNYLNNNFEYNNILSTSSIVFNNNWASEYTKTNKLIDIFYGINENNNVHFLKSPIDKYYENKDFISIEKEYISGSYSFKAITTTNENETIDDLLEKLTINSIRDLYSKEITNESTKTIGIIPEFKIETNCNYYIKDKEINYQKIYFSLNRYGSILKTNNVKEQEIIKPENKDNNHIINLNKPFVFFIWNNELDIPILSGIISNLQ